jgi:hypothetical protein
MLLDLDVGHAADLVNELIDGHQAHVSVREQLAGFAALEGLQF